MPIEINEWRRLHRPQGASLVSVCASEVKLEPVEWLWPGRLARGKHTCIAGEPGTGKSQLTMFIAATVSMGAAWPCGEGQAPCGSVLILSAEDAAADTIAPRLHAAQADLGRVQIIKAVIDEDQRRAFNLQRDLTLLEKEAERMGDVMLVIIDPVSSYLGKTDSHKNAEVRGVLEPIGEFAERMSIAVLSVTHFSKAGANTTTKALHRFIGSIAFVGAPRIALAVIEDSANDRRLLLHAKNNLAFPPKGLAYRIKETIVGKPGRGIVSSHAVWDLEHVAMTANEAMAADAAGEDRHHSLAEAVEFLKDLLADGAIDAKTVKTETDGAGLTWATVRRAKAKLGIKPQRAAVSGTGYGQDGKWVWQLP